ncbi:MAG: hypothetical protein F9K23_18105 [Bacteroidetes bacterium]|nr:MAG: hypothetical protein F9K23_18105 [Bacteroidota bacterium]
MRNLLFIGVYAKNQTGAKSKLYIPIHYIKGLEPITDNVEDGIDEYLVYFTPEVNFHNPEWQYCTSLPMKYRDEIIFPSQID